MVVYNFFEGYYISGGIQSLDLGIAIIWVRWEIIDRHKLYKFSQVFLESYQIQHKKRNCHQCKKDIRELFE